MSTQLLLFIGKPYGYDLDKEYVPFKISQMIDLGYTTWNRNHIEKLHESLRQGDCPYRKLDLVPYFSDDIITKDDRHELRMLPPGVVLKALRKGVRKYPHYEIAISAIELSVKHDDETQIVLFVRC
jgi:hypothetical protein